MTDARSARGGFFRRAGAAVIDLLIVSALYLGFLALGLVAIRLGLRSAGASGPSMELANILWLPYLALWAAITELYIAYWTHTGGQTPGKMALGIRVIGSDDGDPTWAQACLRPPAYLLSWSVLGLGFLMAALPAKRALHDFVTGTRVVRVFSDDPLPTRISTMTTLALLVIVVGTSHARHAAAAELVERIEASVNNRLVKASDLTAYQILFSAQDRSERAAVEILIDRRLLLEEADRFAIPAPESPAIAERIRRVTAGQGSADGLDRALKRMGWTRDDLEAWVAEDLRIADFLDQRIYFFVLIPPDEITAYYASHRDEYAAQSPEDAKEAVTAKLTQERGEDKRRQFMAKVRQKAKIRINPPIDPEQSPPIQPGN